MCAIGGVGTARFYCSCVKLVNTFYIVVGCIAFFSVVYELSFVESVVLDKVSAQRLVICLFFKRFMFRRVCGFVLSIFDVWLRSVRC